MAKHRDKMAHAASEHEEVPDSMAVTNALVERVEHNAAGITKSAGDHPGHSDPAHVVDERLDPDYRDPPHRDVGTNGKPWPLLLNPFHELQCNTRDSHGPHCGEERIAERSSVRAAGERGVSYRNKDVVRRVFDCS